MSQLRRHADALFPVLVAILALMACAVLLSACSGDGDGASTETQASTAKFRTLALLAGPAERGGAGHRDGTGSEARLDHPKGLALAADGSLWLSQVQDGRIKRISPQGEVRTVYDLRAQQVHLAANGRLVSYDTPGAVATGPSGEAYVAVRRLTFMDAVPGQVVDTPDERWAVLRITAAGQADVFAVPSAQNAGTTATALAVDGRGELFIADTYRCAIWRADGKGDAVLVHSSTARADGKPCTAGESFAWAISRMAFDPQGRLVYTRSDGELRRLEADGGASRIGSAHGVAFDCGAMAYAPDGNLVLTDGSTQVYRASPGADATVWAGNALASGWVDGPAADARFGTSCGVAVNAAGDAFVADRDGHTVRRISSAGVVSTLAGLAAQEGYRDGQGTRALFSDALSLGAARDGAVWVADARNYLVRRVDQTGTVTTALGIPRSSLFIATDGPLDRATLARPAAVAEASDGTLWIGDLFSVRRWGKDGVLSTRSVMPDGSVLALAPDSAGNPLVLSGTLLAHAGMSTGPSSYFQFKRYAAQGPGDAAAVALETRLPAGLPVQATDRLPAGMCLGRSGELYFSLGHVLMRRAGDGSVTVYAGAAEQPGSSDGPANEARFDHPAGLACADDGALFVADTGNHTVRRISADRVVTTVLGRAGQPGHIFGAAPGGLDAPRSLALVPGGLVVSSGLGLVIARY